ncbi:hypothetical protein H6P81_020150 [Aristolochia fimbriata]|uniref:Uncharacterized protein n=1 Tax=Aristolochia fimbriata TaxID=158543 RepID=A0AAV7DTM1_ARIFI|nr:hypothetical protein H6P81_020150 [Aristolochia fimbriata]
MNRKGLAILMRTRMKPPTGTIAANDANLSHMKVEKQPFQQVISDETSSFHDSQPSTSQERLDPYGNSYNQEELQWEEEETDSSNICRTSVNEDTTNRCPVNKATGHSSYHSRMGGLSKVVRLF